MREGGREKDKHKPQKLIIRIPKESQIFTIYTQDVGTRLNMLFHNSLFFKSNYA